MTTSCPSILPRGVDERVALSVRRPSSLQPVRVALRVLEAQRVLADLGSWQQLIFRGIEQLREPLGGADAVVEVAARADAVILFPLLDEHHRPALAALVPQVLGGLPLGQEGNAASDAAQPTHVFRSCLRRASAPASAAMSMIARRGFGALRDRPADDQHRRAVGESLRRSDNPLLIADVRSRGPDSRDDEEAIGPCGPRLRNLGARADDSVEAGLASKRGKALVPDLPVELSIADAREVRLDRGW